MTKRKALIQGEVTFRPGDGSPIPIPEGEVEMDEAEDSVTLSWQSEPEVLGSAALPRQQYEQYVKAGKIRPLD